MQMLQTICASRAACKSGVFDLGRGDGWGAQEKKQELKWELP